MGMILMRISTGTQLITNTRIIPTIPTTKDVTSAIILIYQYISNQIIY
jgi:hypothetical protein